MRGKAAILFIFLVAFGMAGFAWWWNFTRSQQIRALLGTPHVAAIQYGEKVEGFQLSYMLAPENSLNFPSHQDSNNVIQDPVDLSQAPGIQNARYWLTQDASYEWPRPAVISAEFTAGIRFTHRSQPSTFVFDFKQQLIGCWESGEIASLNPKTAAGWRGYLDRHLGKTGESPKK